MKKLCLLVMLVMAIHVVSHADVLTFGPLCTGSCTVDYFGAYGGFQWTQFGVMSNGYYDSFYNNTYGAPSGAGAWGNGYSGLPKVYSPVPFTFIGADLTSLAQYDGDSYASAETITIDAYDASATLIGTCGASLSLTSYNFLSCNIPNVSELVFTTHNSDNPDYAYWLMDNFTYQTTPEPSSVSLLIAGFAGMVGLVRRKSH